MLLLLLLLLLLYYPNDLIAYRELIFKLFMPDEVCQTALLILSIHLP